jgi:hypothetical protein
MIWSGVQAPHPHEEEHQPQARPARPGQRARERPGQHRQDAADGRSLTHFNVRTRSY